MTAYEKDMLKIQDLQQEIASLQSYVTNLETEYRVVTDQYMEGVVTADVGKYQNKLKRERDRALKHIENKSTQLRRLVQKYS